MAKYAVIGILSILFSFIIEISANSILKGESFNFHFKINIKRLVAVLSVNIAVWIAALYFISTSIFSVILLCLTFDILICISICDYYTKEIPNLFLVLLFVLAVIFTVFDKQTVWYMHIFGCAMGYLPMLLIELLGKAAKKQDVLGSGDVYLSGILGLLLGLQNFLFCGFFTCLCALIVIRIIRHKKKYDKMHYYPFSPFFTFGYAISMLFANLIFEQYYSVLII